MPLKRKPNPKMVTFKGLSGTQIEVNTKHRDAGRWAILATGERVQVLGHVPLNFFNKIAIRLPDGRVTTVASGKLRYEE